jgi:L-fuconolactonase
MKIDAHQHFWKYNSQRDRWITDEMSVLRRDFLPEHLIGELRANGIDSCIAVQADQSEDETEFLLNLAGRYDSMIQGVVGWLDLSSPYLPERLAHFTKFKKLRGLRHIVQSEPDDRFILRPDFCRGIARLKDFGLTFDILIYPRQLPAAIEVVEKFPDQMFVLDHLAKPLIRAAEIEPWAKHIRILAGNPNVYCKLSGLVTEANWTNWQAADFDPYLDVAFDAFGPDRLMFGSDWPVCLLAASYQQVRDVVEQYITRFQIDSRDKILGLNAVRFYGLTVNEPASQSHGPAS